MHCLVLGRLPVGLAQEDEPLLMAVTYLATSDERTVQRAERGEQRRVARASLRCQDVCAPSA